MVRNVAVAPFLRYVIRRILTTSDHGKNLRMCSSDDCK